MKVCSNGDGKKVVAWGLCDSCYRRTRRAGTPPPDKPRMSAADIQYLSDLVEAACPRFILIAHPNFRLPEGVAVAPRVLTTLARGQR